MLVMMVMMMMIMVMIMMMTPAREGTANHIAWTRTDWFCFLVSLNPGFMIITRIGFGISAKRKFWQYSMICHSLFHCHSRPYFYFLSNLLFLSLTFQHLYIYLSASGFSPFSSFTLYITVTPFLNFNSLLYFHFLLYFYFLNYFHFPQFSNIHHYHLCICLSASGFSPFSSS